MLPAIACIAAAACTTQHPTKPDARDPWERMNRATFAFNDQLDRAIAKPVARTYQKVAPQFVQTGVANFYSNVGYPTVFINDALQGKLRQFAHDAGRFLLNTTVGLGGILDPATPVGLDSNNEDFGQTMGVWGVKTGPYLMLPILGPSDIRDGFGLIPEEFTDGRHYIKSTTVSWGVRGLGLVNRRARLLGGESLLNQTYDRYSFIRNAYLERRNYLVKDGNVPEAEPADAGMPPDEDATPESPPADKPQPPSGDAAPAGKSEAAAPTQPASAPH
ncbi:MAG TPA: MlaA family lipoprotein [Steroidobacteraceae bacterium]